MLTKYKKQIEEDRKTFKGVTEGPWEVEHVGLYYFIRKPDTKGNPIAKCIRENEWLKEDPRDNVKLVAQSRTRWPASVDREERLVRALEKAVSVIKFNKSKIELVSDDYKVDIELEKIQSILEGG